MNAFAATPPRPGPGPRLAVRRLTAAGLLLGLAFGPACLPTAATASSDAAPLPPLDPQVAALVDRYADAAAREPSSAVAQARLAMVYEANQLWPQARDAYARAVALAPDQSLWLYHQAVATRQAGDPAAALSLLRRVTASRPDYPAPWQRLGQALLEIGDLDGSEAAFHRVVELAPAAADGYIGLGAARLQRQAYGAAAEALERALELEPDVRSAHHLLGLAYRGLGRGDEAARHLALGVDAEPRALGDPLSDEIAGLAVHLTAKIDAAAGFLRRRDPAAAAEILLAAVEDHPRNVTLLNNLAVAYLQLGRLDEAKEVLDRSLAADGAKFATYLNLSSWAARADRPEEALRYAEAAVERGGGSAACYSSRARALFRLGRYEAAADDLEAAAALDPRDPALLMALAGLDERLGRADRARASYATLSERWPRAPEPWLGLARLELSSGSPEAARSAWERAHELAPQAPAVVDFERRLPPAGEDG